MMSASAEELSHRLAYDRILVAEIELIWRRHKIGAVIPVLFASMHLFTTLLLALDLALIPSPHT